MRQASRLTRFFIATVFAATLFTMQTLAVEVADDDDESTALSASNLCARIESVMTSSTARISERRDTLKTNFSNRLVKLETNRATVEENLATARQQTSDAFAQKIDELKALPGLNDEQLKAIDTYETNMIKAENTRKEAVDTARQTYQSGLRQTISDRQDDLSEATATYNAAVTAAFEKAESNCSSSSALTALRSDLGAARNALATARSITTPRTEIQSLAETRNTSIQAANQAFRVSAKEHAETLAATLGITVTITVETTPEPES